MNIVSTTKIPSTKGNLAAAIHYPKEETDRLAILCPGYLDSKDYKHLVGLAERLCEENYTVVRFDPTGTWGSGGKISDYTTTQYLKDLKSVLDYMLHQKRYKHILIGGHSRGGMVSILYSARDPRISRVLAIMPSSGRSMMGKRRDDWEKNGVSISKRDLPQDRNKIKEFQVPLSHLVDRDKYNVLEDVKKIRVPIIFIAGEADELIPPEDVEVLFNNAKEPKNFITVPGVGHDYRFNDDEIRLVDEKILELLKNY